MAQPRAGHWGANCHLEGQKSNHSFFITYCFPSIPLPVFTLFLPPVVRLPDILWLLWFNCTLKLSAGISSCSFRKINSVSRDQIPWRSKSWTCSGALINFKLVWACSVLGVHRRRLWLDYGCVYGVFILFCNTSIQSSAIKTHGFLGNQNKVLHWLGLCDNTNKCCFLQSAEWKGLKKLFSVNHSNWGCDPGFGYGDTCGWVKSCVTLVKIRQLNWDNVLSFILSLDNS